MKAPLIIAHRTCPVDAAENSLAGIKIAADRGADVVEIDLRMSLDQHPFLMHDWTMRRTTGFPLPLELTPASVARGRYLQHTGEHVHSLYEALDALPEGLTIAVDVKTPWAVVPLLREVERRGIEERVLVWCTSALAVRYAAWRLPAVEIAYLKDVTSDRGKRRFLAKAMLIGADAVSAHWRAIDARFVSTAHALGLRVYSWHGGGELTPGKLSAGLDGLITDFPREARAAYEALSSSAQALTLP